MLKVQGIDIAKKLAEWVLELRQRGYHPYCYVYTDQQTDPLIGLRVTQLHIQNAGDVALAVFEGEEDQQLVWAADEQYIPAEWKNLRRITQIHYFY